MPSDPRPDPKLDRLLQFLARDPGNLTLLRDAAETAYGAGDYERAKALLDRYRAIAALPPALANLAGMTALAQRHFDTAAAIFAALRASAGDDPALRFNQAWANAMMGAHREALDLLDAATVAASPRGPGLKIEMMHHLGLLDDALAEGEALARLHPGNGRLMGALANAAMDAERPDLAQAYAARAGDDPDGRAVLGMLALADHHEGEALALFDKAIAAEPGNGRAWVGKGLGLLSSGKGMEAARALDRGAEIFCDHLGSWVAAGWAYFLDGDHAKARARFETALAIDPSFAEIHGGLAVMDVLAGDLASARKRCETAQRLDRNCLGAALAQALLLERGGHGEMARRVREIAMSRPIGPKGETIAQALVAAGMRK